jgi:hypothetical protein
MKNLDVNLENTDLINKIINEVQKVDIIGSYQLTTEVILEEVRYIYLDHRDSVTSHLDCEVVIKDGEVIKDNKGAFINDKDLTILWSRCYGRLKDSVSFNLYCRECSHCKSKFYDTAMKISQHICSCFKKENYRDVSLKTFKKTNTVRDY